MANRQRRFNALLIAAALVIIGFVTVFYVDQLDLRKYHQLDQRDCRT